MKKTALISVVLIGACFIAAGCSTVDLAALAKAQKGRIMIDYLITEPPYILEIGSDGAEKPGYFITLNGKKIVPFGTRNNYDIQQNLDDFNKKLAEGTLIILNKVPTDRQSSMPPETLARLKEILASSKPKTDKLAELQKAGFYYEAADILEKNK